MACKVVHSARERGRDAAAGSVFYMPSDLVLRTRRVVGGDP